MKDSAGTWERINTNIHTGIHTGHTQGDVLILAQTTQFHYTWNVELSWMRFDPSSWFPIDGIIPIPGWLGPETSQ